MPGQTHSPGSQMCTQPSLPVPQTWWWPRAFTLHAHDAPSLLVLPKGMGSSLGHHLAIFVAGASCKGAAILADDSRCCYNSNNNCRITAIIFKNREGNRKIISCLSIKLTLSWILNLREVQVMAVPLGTAFIWKQDEDMDHLGNLVAQVIAKTHLTFFEKELVLCLPQID